MVLYFSAGTEHEYFRCCQEQGLVKSGYQAQKFNQLILEGMGHHTTVTAVGNLPFAMDQQQEIAEYAVTKNRVTYIALGCKPGKKRKLENLRAALRHGAACCKTGQVEGIVCDAVNPLAALCSLMLGKHYGIPALAVVTDIPSILSTHPSRFARLADRLMRRFDGYILLTQAMNPLVNPDNKPFIVMEGLCDIDAPVPDPAQSESYCLYTGSLSLGTGIENLAEGFSRYRPEGYTLRILGGGELAERLKKNPPEGVEYGGAVTNQEAVDAQRRAALLINPRPLGLQYTDLSFPSKIMEYMVSGTPVLTTMLPGIPKEYFSYVFAAQDDTADGLGREITRILSLSEEERKEMGRQGRAFVLEKKNNVYQTARILELIRRCRLH